MLELQPGQEFHSLDQVVVMLVMVVVGVVTVVMVVVDIGSYTVDLAGLNPAL